MERNIDEKMRKALKNPLFAELFEANPHFMWHLFISEEIECARKRLHDYLNRQMLYMMEGHCKFNPIEISNARACLRVLRNIISERSEIMTGHSALRTLWKFARGGYDDEEFVSKYSRGFWEEFIHLIQGVEGIATFFGMEEEETKLMRDVEKSSGRKAACLRSKFLNYLSQDAERFIKRYPVGIDPEVVEKRKENRERILHHFNANIDDWNDWRWHFKNVVVDLETIQEIIELTDEETEAISLAIKYNLPFGITPYYLSLMDRQSHRKYDHAVRAQVIPPLSYVKEVIRVKQSGNLGRELDYMKEFDTSPINLVTRRYPKIAILKIYNACPQICVYCQRNWEIKCPLDPEAYATESEIKAALNWFENEKDLSEVLITGGDPFVLSEARLEKVISRLASMEHIERIRIGTRTPVTVPMRITDSLVNMLKKYHQVGRREICIVTHFEHSYEVTPEAAQAVQKLRQQGFNIYNQQVFTVENSRKFETLALKRAMKLIGVQAYYTFVAKGKKETLAYRAPIARIIQELKEESRLFPGMLRTDHRVFNVPGQGKNYVFSTDHEVLMILPNGARIYEFHPWEKPMMPVKPYLHEDIPIYDYLQEMKRRGEDINEYRTIWYYF